MSRLPLPAPRFVQRPGPFPPRRFRERGLPLCGPRLLAGRCDGRGGGAGEGALVGLTSPPACRMSQECDVLLMHSCPDVSKNFPACPFSPVPSHFISAVGLFSLHRCFRVFLSASSTTVSVPLGRPISALVNKHVGPTHHLTSEYSSQTFEEAQLD